MSIAVRGPTSVIDKLREKYPDWSFHEVIFKDGKLNHEAMSGALRLGLRVEVSGKVYQLLEDGVLVQDVAELEDADDFDDDDYY